MKTIIKIALGILLAYLIITHLSTVLGIATVSAIFTAKGAVTMLGYLQENVAILIVIAVLFIAAIIAGKKSKKESK